MQKDQVLPNDWPLRKIYNVYLHPEVIDTDSSDIWDALAAGSVLDVFQFSTGVGLAMAKKLKPKNPIEMTAANAMIRLMSEPGVESQQDRYYRIKNLGIEIFDKEMRDHDLPEAMIKALHGYCDEYYGCVPIQEQMMMILMDKNISSFTLAESNDARKIVAKKQMKRIPELKEHFYSTMKKEYADYVWELAIAPQLGYAFSLKK
jgi:DNA polymerase III alpha subunit